VRWAKIKAQRLTTKQDATKVQRSTLETKVSPSDARIAIARAFTTMAILGRTRKKLVSRVGNSQYKPATPTCVATTAPPQVTIARNRPVRAVSPVFQA